MPASSTAAVPFTPEGVLEPGDRFELVPAGVAWLLPEPLVVNRVPFDTLQDENGRSVSFTLLPEEGSLVLPEALSQPRPAGGGPLWLEYRSRGRFRLIVEPVPPPGPGDDDHRAGRADRASTRATGRWSRRHGAACRPTWPSSTWRLRAARLATHAGFDRLICLPLVRDMELLEHQIRTAKTVLRRFRGRALLCDEVGLGKTIEAGLILAELRLRGLIRSVLVLVPPSLIEQWQGEMRRKFSLELISHDDPAFRERGTAAWNEFDRVIASIHTAKREPHRSAILGRQWDLVIVDEAHHLRNRNTQLWKFASELQKQFILLLTATPVQNNLEELFNLVTLLEPGLLSTAKQFQKHFVDRKRQADAAQRRRAARACWPR